MVATMSPWSAAAEVDGETVALSILLTTDAGPMREFKPYLDVALDEPHALILFGELGLALQAIANARHVAEPDNVVPIGSGRPRS